jgi:RNA polymerase sigma factor (sigma-70 family)
LSIGESFPSVLQAARLGADWAWGVIYRDLAPALLGYLRIRGAHEPEDLTGEVFLQIVRGLNNFEGNESDFRSWVFMVAHHRLVDERRARSRRLSDPAPAEELEQNAALGDTEDEALAVLSLEWIRDLMRQVTPTQADVLLLRIIGGLSLEQVSSIVGKRPGAVKALQRRGLATIRRKIASHTVPLKQAETVTELRCGA